MIEHCFLFPLFAGGPAQNLAGGCLEVGAANVVAHHTPSVEQGSSDKDLLSLHIQNGEALCPVATERWQ